MMYMIVSKNLISELFKYVFLFYNTKRTSVFSCSLNIQTDSILYWHTFSQSKMTEKITINDFDIPEESIHNSAYFNYDNILKLSCII